MKHNKKCQCWANSLHSSHARLVPCLVFVSQKVTSVYYSVGFPVCHRLQFQKGVQLSCYIFENLCLMHSLFENVILLCNGTIFFIIGRLPEYCAYASSLVVFLCVCPCVPIVQIIRKYPPEIVFRSGMCQTCFTAYFDFCRFPTRLNWNVTW